MYAEIQREWIGGYVVQDVAGVETRADADEDGWFQLEQQRYPRQSIILHFEFPGVVFALALVYEVTLEWTILVIVFQVGAECVVFLLDLARYDGSLEA